MSVSQIASGRGVPELALDQVVVDGGRWACATPVLLERRGPQALLAAEPPHPPLAELVARRLELVGEKPIPELGIVLVEFDERAWEVSVVEVPRWHQEARGH